MGFKARVMRTVKSAYASLSNGMERRRYLASVRTHIEKATDVPIPELSADAQKEIKSYWDAYGIQLSSTEWHRFFYAKTGQTDPRFVSADVFHKIIRPMMNDIYFATAWSDKAYTDWVVRDVKTVCSVVRSVNGRLLDERFGLIDQKTANDILNRYEALVLKPTLLTNTGKNVSLERAPFDIAAIIKRYGRNFVAQLPLKQHPEISLLNESSVNTIRVDTVLFEREAHAIPSFIKVGQPGQFTDNGGGENRIFIGIQNGRYADFAFDHDCNRFAAIPSGYAYAGQKVPGIEEICRAAEKAHTRIPRFGLAFWDIALDENGEPVIVEMNLRQPDTYVPQVASGPFFGEYTDDVLRYIKRR